MEAISCTRELPELDALLGLVPVKAQISRLAQRLGDERCYRALGLGVFPVKRHLVFSGPRGVGKNAVACAFGAICQRFGALDKGHVVVVDHSDLAETNAEKKVGVMRACCEAALDGILYVRNDAFLNAGILRSTGDLRLDPVDILISFMMRYRGRIIVILDSRPNQLGYISFHSGLARQFAETIEFPAYDAFELLQILAAKASERGFVLPEGIEADLFPWIVASASRGDWSNAEEIITLLARAILAREKRLMNESGFCTGLERSDFRQALRSMRADYETGNAAGLAQPQFMAGPSFDEIP